MNNNVLLFETHSRLGLYCCCKLNDERHARTLAVWRQYEAWAADVVEVPSEPCSLAKARPFLHATEPTCTGRQAGERKGRQVKWVGDENYVCISSALISSLAESQVGANVAVIESRFVHFDRRGLANSIPSSLGSFRPTYCLINDLDPKRPWPQTTLTPNDLDLKWPWPFTKWSLI